MTTIGKILTALAVVAAVRLTLIDNPWIWRLYGRALEPERIGWRQDSALRKRIESLEPLPPPTRYLAVGSSQTNAIYQEYATQNADLSVFELAAMGPFDFVTHLEQIERYRPEIILLYLSDFDIARQPAREALVLAPEQGLHALGLWRDILVAPSGWDTGPLLAEMLLGEVFPEFKYRFVFRGLVDETFRRIANRVGGRPAGQGRVVVDERIRFLRESIDTEHADFNLYFLHRFLEATSDLGVSVAIVEGQYNPTVATNRTRGAETWVRDRVARAAGSYDHVRFLGRGEVPELTEEDFQDLTHVTAEAGLRFAAAVLHQIEGRSGGGAN